MPMIDVYATTGTFAEPRALVRELAATLMKIEGVPDITMFRKNTAAFVHDLSAGELSNVDGDSNYVRVQVLTNAGALDRDKQLAVVRQFTDLVADAASEHLRVRPGSTNANMRPTEACPLERGHPVIGRGRLVQSEHHRWCGRDPSRSVRRVANDLILVA